MFPFNLSRRHRPRTLLRLLALLTGFLGGAVRAKGADYATDPTLSVTTVDVGKHNLRPVSLAEIFTIVETEASMKINYPPGTFSLGEEVVLETDGVFSLAKLFGMVSAQKDLEFERTGTEIAVRAVKSGAGNRGQPSYAANLATEARAGGSEFAPRPAAVSAVAAAEARATDGAAAGELAAAVAGIAGDTQSRSRREKRIGGAVGTAITGAAAKLEAKADVLDVAVELVTAAASAAPSFAETIAAAAAFAAPVKTIKGGAARVRSAAFTAARSPKSTPPVTRRSNVGRADPVPVADRPDVIRVPVGQTPETFEFKPAAEAPPAGTSSAAAPTTSDAAGSLFAARNTASESAPANATAASPALATSEAAPSLGAIGAPPIELPSSSAPASGALTAGADGVVKMEKFGVEGTATKGSSRDLRTERVKAVASIDFLSADQLAKFGAADLSDVVFRIPGVSVAGGQFAVVRGLSDRFLSTTLQGIKLPTPDPEKQAVQLDLIPASAVEAVVVSKTFEPSLWAESSGGNMDVRTRAIPTESLLKLSVGFKQNSNAAKGGPDYPIRGATNERLGLGSRSRIQSGAGDKTWDYVPTHRSSFPLGNKISLEYAHAFNIGERQLGVLADVFSEAAYKSKTGTRQFYQAAGGQPATAAVPASGSKPAVAANPGRPSDFEKGAPSIIGDARNYEQSETENVVGATTALGFKFSSDHELKFTGVFVQTGNDLSFISGLRLTTDPVTKLPTPVTSGGGFTGAEDYTFYKSLEYFRERNLTVLQLSGRHNFERLGNLKLNWSGQRGTSYETQSPYIDAGFQTPLANFGKSYVALGGSDAPQALKVIWADNQEKQQAGRLDFDWPFRLWGKQSSNLTFGGALEKTDRETTGNSIDYRLNSGGTVTATTPNEVFAKIVGKQTGITTPPTTAKRETRAYYTGVNIYLFDPLKLVVGNRYEDFTLASAGSGRWGSFPSSAFFTINPAKGILGTTGASTSDFESKKWYPSAGLIYTPWKTLTTRLAYSKTTGRPSLREVSPFFNKSIETDNLVIGNPSLKPSEVTNYDIRIEWSPTKTDFIALSVFRKDIESPIEKRIFTQTQSALGENTESWFNNPNRALVKGLELEFRHQFKSWSEALKDFSLSGNFTRIEATVGETVQVLSELSGTYQDPTKIPRTRRLFDQPEYIANLDLTWAHSASGTSATVAVFAISDVLVGAAKPFYYDLYERASTRVDLLFNQQLAARLKLKLAVKNLADPVRGLIYDREVTNALFERNTYRTGRDYSASLTYEF